MNNYSNSTIEMFIDQYSSDKDSYDKLCRITKKRIQEILDQKGIMSIVTARVKKPDRLHEKLIQRNQERLQNGKPPYQSFQDIYTDIPDLVGARIALYFPGDAVKIEDLLPPFFIPIKAKDFPEKIDEFDTLYKTGFTAYKRRIYPGYENRKFDGYCAIHHRVKFANSPVKKLENIVIEIQVASVLMHAWSEVEHDLAYKKKMGNVSREEYECLDEINGLVMAGEIALNRLNQLSEQRIRNSRVFETHYTLAIYISDWQKRHHLNDVPLGNVEALYEIYKRSNTLTYADLDKQLDILEHHGLRENEPLADQLIEVFSRNNHRSIVKNVISQAIIDSNGLDPSSSLNTKLGIFLGKWNVLEDRIKKALRKLGYTKVTRIEHLQLIERKFVLTTDFAATYQRLRKARNQIVHGQIVPTESELESLIVEIEQLSNLLKEKFSL